MEGTGVARIECVDVTKRYRGRAAVKGVTLTIGGGICAMLGANGAGKSTLLKLMTGLEKVDAGTLRVAGFEVSSRAAEMKRTIGVLPDSLGLFESLTVLENLRCVGPIYGLSEAETEARAESLLRLLELERGRDTFAAECSYGMRKKTALAMALIHTPRVLFLDEPFEGIDPSSSRVIERTLVDVAARGTTVLLTSHILPLVERLATRIVLLHAGTIAWDSDAATPDRPLEQMYFNTVGEPRGETPAWLR